MNAQQLKNSILQLAVQGKLVPQDPNDEPASALIERIKAEKERLIKEKKIKPDKNPSYIFRGSDNLPYEKVGKNEPVCIADEVPFDIPDSWEWVRLGNITEILRGKGPKYAENTRFKILNQKCVRWGDVDTSFCKTVDKNWFESIPMESLTTLQDVLINSTGEGTIGRSSVVTSDAINLPYDSHVLLIRPYKCINTYIEIFINGVEGQAQINRSKGAKTTKQTELGVDKTKNLLIPLPPLNEQRRIVEKLEKLEPYINDYDKAYEKIEKLNTDFPDLLKKSILQEAVQGKLVPQYPTDEPASVLIEQIRQEKEQLIKDKKIKKDKNESYIFRRDNSHYEKIGKEERCIDDEIPFDIPDSWEWTRFGSVINLTSGQDLTPDMYNSDRKGIPYITGASNIENENIIINRWTDKGRAFAYKGNLLLTCKGTVGTMAILNQERVHIARQVMGIDTYSQIYIEYIKIFLESYINTLKSKAKSMIPGISRDDVLNILFPLPPLNEQQRIVEYYKNILPKIKALK